MAYPKLRKHLKDKELLIKLKITTVVELDSNGTFKGIMLKISQGKKARFRIFSGWYMWKFKTLEAEPLPNEICEELDAKFKQVEQKWNDLVKTLK